MVGASGMLGLDVCDVLARAGRRVEALTSADLDITDAEACRQTLAARDVDVVVNCAAYTAVDDAETHEAVAFAVNAVGAANLARAAHARGARLVQISTDYVFPGTDPAPIPEDAAPAPRSAYGRTKAAGEWAVAAGCPDHVVVRTAWLYGTHGTCFPRTMARLLSERDGVAVVDDQRGQPTWTRDLAGLLVRLIDAGVPAGIYHGTSSGAATWYDLAREVAQTLGMPAERVQPTTTEVFPRPAPRPASSVLGHDALVAAGVEPIADWRQRWQEAAPAVLADYLSEAPGRGR